MTTNTNTVHLQGLGTYSAIPAADLRIGHILSWNYSPCGYEVVAIVDASPKFLKVTERNRKTGAETVRRINKATLVAAS